MIGKRAATETGGGPPRQGGDPAAPPRGTTPTAEPRVAFAGEPGSFAEDAVIAYFGAHAAAGIPFQAMPFRAIPVPTFADAVDAVSQATTDAAVVPIENVVFGTVREVYDLLAAAPV